jgi:hypothetical protein
MDPLIVHDIYPRLPFNNIYPFIFPFLFEVSFDLKQMFYHYKTLQILRTEPKLRSLEKSIITFLIDLINFDYCKDYTLSKVFSLSKEETSNGLVPIRNNSIWSKLLDNLWNHYIYHYFSLFHTLKISTEDTSHSIFINSEDFTDSAYYFLPPSIHSLYCSVYLNPFFYSNSILNLYLLDSIETISRKTFQYFKSIKLLEINYKTIFKIKRKSFYSFKNLLIDFQSFVNLKSIGSLSFSKCLS